MAWLLLSPIKFLGKDKKKLRAILRQLEGCCENRCALLGARRARSPPGARTESQRSPVPRLTSADTGLPGGQGPAGQQAPRCPPHLPFWP